MEQIKILGKDAFKIIRLINKFGLKEELKDIIKLGQLSEKKNRAKNLKIIELLKEQELENNTENVKKLMEENEEVINLISTKEEVDYEMMERGLFLILDGLGNAEKEIFEVLSSIYDKPVKDIKETELNDLVKMIKNVIMSPSLKGVFTSMFK